MVCRSIARPELTSGTSEGAGPGRPTRALPRRRRTAADLGSGGIL